MAGGQHLDAIQSAVASHRPSSHSSPSPIGLPEILFGDNFLELEHKATGRTIRIDAIHALNEWMAADLPPLTVPVAEKWASSRQEEISLRNAKTLFYDWTYTTPYSGHEVQYDPDLRTTEGEQEEQEQDNEGGEDGPHGKVPPGGRLTPFPSSTASLPHAATAVEAHAVNSRGTTYPAPSASALRTSRATEDPLAAATAAASAAHWLATEDKIDRSMLLARDPILFYEDIPLYESELDDHGVSQLHVKVRVMPKCWFVLMRFFLRIDGLLVKMRETRWFCAFEGKDATGGERRNRVVREVTWREGTMDELRRAGAPSDGHVYRDPEQASVALQAVAPVGVKRYEMKRSAFARQKHVCVVASSSTPLSSLSTALDRQLSPPALTLPPATEQAALELIRSSPLIRAFGRGRPLPKRTYTLDELRLNKIEPTAIITPTDETLQRLERTLQAAAAAGTVAAGVAAHDPGVSISIALVASLLAVTDQIASRGALGALLLDTLGRLVNASYARRVALHEAGHFLIAYLCGVLPRGYTLSAVDALRTYGAQNVQAGTLLCDAAFQQEVATGKVSGGSVDRVACIALAGVATEYLRFGTVEGGRDDVAQLDGLLNALGFSQKKADAQVRWALLQTVLLLRTHRVVQDRLAEEMMRGASVGRCIEVIERVVNESELGGGGARVTSS